MWENVFFICDIPIYFCHIELMIRCAFAFREALRFSALLVVGAERPLSLFMFGISLTLHHKCDLTPYQLNSCSYSIKALLNGLTLPSCF